MRSGPQRDLSVTGLAWPSLDDATKALLRPLIDAGILVTIRDPETLTVTVRFAGQAVAWDSQAIAAYIEENREFLAWRQKIHARASLWDKGGRPPELLLSEEETRAAQRSKTERGAELTEAERVYLDESLKHYGGFRPPVPTGDVAPLILQAQVQAPGFPSQTPAPGEFTRMFSSPVKGVEPPQPVWPSPPPQASEAQAPGAFTQMFQTPTAAPQPPPPRALPPLAAAPARRRFAVVVALTAIATVVLLFGLFFVWPHPKSAPPSGTLQSQPIDQAQTAIQNGAYDDAVKILTRAIDAGTPLYAQRALAYRLSGNLDAAVADYDRAIKSGQADNQVYADEAYVLMLKGEWNQSAHLLTDAIGKDPSNVNFYVNRGKAYIAMGDFKAALDDFKNALTRDPISAAAQSGKATALLKLGHKVTPQEAPPRVYIQVSSEVQSAQAKHLQDTLTDLGYTVPPYEIVGQKSPSKNEVRFILADDQAQAERLAAELRKANFPVNVKQIATPHRPDAGFRHFELWFARVNARAQQKAY